MRGHQPAADVRRILVTSFVFAAASAASAQQPARGPAGQSGLVYSDSASFWIDAPAGWVLDAEAGRRDGPIVVLYRQGQSWRTGEPVMYANVMTANGTSIAAAIRADSSEWGTQVKDLVFRARDSVATAGGGFAQIRVFESASTRHYETVAYLAGPKRVWLLVLTARSAAAHENAFADFLTLVKSYAPGPAVKKG